jgi:ADP-ribosylglycohydrolase
MAWSEAANILRELGPAAGLPMEEIELVLAPSQRQNAKGSGYVVDTLWSARVAVEGTAGYADAVRRAIAFGNDTDTTAAVAGGIAGIRYGLEGIPLAWRRQLRGQELLEPLQQAFMAWLALS